MVKRVFHGRIIPLIVIFGLMLVMVLSRGLVQMRSGTEFVQGVFDGLTLGFALTSILYISIFVRFTVKYLEFKKKLGK